MSTETNEYPDDELDTPESDSDDGHPAALLGRYALGALDPDESELVTRHVQQCLTCRAELDEYEAAVRLLPYAAPVRQVPVRARAGLLARLDEVGTSNPGRLIVLRPPARERWSVAAWLRQPLSPRALAFAAAPLIVIIAVVGIMANVINDQQAQLATIEAERDAVDTVLLDTAENQPAQASFISSTSAQQARAKLIVNRDTNSALILARGLPEVEDGQHYIAWLRMADENEYARAGVLELDDEGRASLVVEPRDAIDTYAEVVITLETDAEASQPAGPRVMTAAVVSSQ